MLFIERLDRAIAGGSATRTTVFAVLFVDLDRFKHVNDSLGHAAGDQLLIAFSERLAAAVRHDDVVSRMLASREGAPEANTLARFGGDEFVILLDDIREPIDAVRVAERIQAVAAAPLQRRRPRRCLPARASAWRSAPTSTAPPTSCCATPISRCTGRRRRAAAATRFSTPTMHHAAVERLRLETELRRAVERREFRLRYQPIVSLETRHVTGYEALVRWQHPDRGLLAPGGVPGGRRGDRPDRRDRRVGSLRGVPPGTRVAAGQPRRSRSDAQRQPVGEVAGLAAIWWPASREC